MVGVLGGKLPPFWNSAGKLHFTIGGIRESLPWSQYHRPPAFVKSFFGFVRGVFE